MALIYFAAVLGVILISYEIIKAISGDARKISLWFRLRRRKPFRSSLRLSLMLLWPRILCATGRHDLMENTSRTVMLVKALPGYEFKAGQLISADEVDKTVEPTYRHPLTCRRWFCSRFADQSPNVHS